VSPKYCTKQFLLTVKSLVEVFDFFLQIISELLALHGSVSLCIL